MIDPIAFATKEVPTVSVTGISKSYRLYHRPNDRLKEALMRPFGKVYSREFSALKDISFSLNKGDSLGILGRNGSGKSTLLQIIAGVLTPTTGSVAIQGRVSALLELGSGFNLEYTGRENVFMSGAILGISHREMEERFDEIAAFADIGEYIDQPVKTYSSGMFARLAFSVATMVNPDILIVDEILSVGDYGFQQKCVARMKRMRESGLTLLFVSHSPDAIKDTCTHGLFLNQGQMAYWGTAEAASDQYLRYVREVANQEVLRSQESLKKSPPLQTRVSNSLRYGSYHAQVEKVEITDDAGHPRGFFEFAEYINIHVFFIALEDIANFNVNFGIRDNTGITILGTSLFDERRSIPLVRSQNRGHIRFRFINHLHHGNYGVGVGLTQVSQRDFSDNLVLDAILDCGHFIVNHNPDRPIWYKVFSPIQINAELDDVQISSNDDTSTTSGISYLHWDEDKIRSFHDWVSQWPFSEEEYFSRQVGKGIIHFTNLYKKTAGRVLDYGCGPGYLINELLDQGIGCEGMDFSLKAVDSANAKFKNHPLWGGAKWVNEYTLPYNDEAFDLIFFIETIEHLLPDSTATVLQELRRILAPQRGLLFLTTPNNEVLERNMVFCPDCRQAYHRYQHICSFTRDTLMRLMEDNGFQTELCDVTDFRLFQQDPLPEKIDLPRYIGSGPHLFWVGSTSSFN